MSAHKTLAELKDAPFEVDDPGAGNPIVLDRWAENISMAITAAGETNTLEAPTQAGLELALFVMAVSNNGTRVVTVASAVNASGNTKMTFDAVNDFVVMRSFRVSDSAFEWRVVSSNGVAFN